MLLALDTATDTISVSLHAGARVLGHRSIDAERRHAEVLVPTIDEVLVEAGASTDDLTSIAIGVGPGAFTGLRVGLVTARTLGLALEVGCVGVMTLDALAWSALDGGVVGLDEPFAVAVDARRHEVFWALYEHGRRVGEPAAARPDALASGLLAGLTVVGDAGRRYPDAFDAWVPAVPSALAVAAIAQQADDRARAFAVVEPTPVYVRRPDATEPGARKPVTPAGGR